jgi:hypothetical protein
LMVKSRPPQIASTGGTPVSRWRRLASISVVPLIVLASPLHAAAAEPPAHELPTSGLIDHDVAWPGVVLICVFGLLLMAALVGPLVRANQFEDEPDGEGPGE